MRTIDQSERVRERAQRGDYDPRVRLLFPLLDQPADMPHLGPGDTLGLIQRSGRVVVERHCRPIGWVAAVLEDPDTWAARAVVERVAVERVVISVHSVHLIPYPVELCGCVDNLGGWTVRYCNYHAADLDYSARCDHDRLLIEKCGWCEHDGRDKDREDRRAAERSW